MNQITATLLESMVLVYFLYGLAFFVMGVALALASRRESDLWLVRVIGSLAVFGLIHGAHEWIEMFQLISMREQGRMPGLAEEFVRLTILVISFLALLIFAADVNSGPGVGLWRRHRLTVLFSVAWAVATVLVWWWYGVQGLARIGFADILARYLLAIPAAILAARGLMRQQHIFRELAMPQFGSDLVWASTALLLYGAVGQIFVRPMPLPPSNILNSALFLEWFGIPVQLFRAVMAVALTIFVVRGLRALELENSRRLDSANQARLAAQERALAAERHVSQERELLNRQLETQARELALLLDLSNLLAETSDLDARLSHGLQRMVDSLPSMDASLVLLAVSHSRVPHVAAVTGFVASEDESEEERQAEAIDLGWEALKSGQAICEHQDEVRIAFDLGAVLVGEECWAHHSPARYIALPLEAPGHVIGSVVFARLAPDAPYVALEELKLMAGIARQLGLSIDNAQLAQQAQEQEERLRRLLRQVVGAQESERQRIARELHDVTGQSLSAIALGLRGVSKVTGDQTPQVVSQIDALQTFATDALGELRRIIADLRPPQLDDLGLNAALRWYVRSFQEHHSDLEVSLTVPDRPVRLLPEHETILLRILQEALTNVARHAHASRTTVTLEMFDGQLQLTVEDNGRGFDTDEELGRQGAAASWGLMGIGERARLMGGTHQIRSAPGKGTTIRVWAPIMAEQEPQTSASGQNDDSITVGEGDDADQVAVG